MALFRVFNITTTHAWGKDKPVKMKGLVYVSGSSVFVVIFLSFQGKVNTLPPTCRVSLCSKFIFNEAFEMYNIETSAREQEKIPWGTRLYSSDYSFLFWECQCKHATCKCDKIWKSWFCVTCQFSLILRKIKHCGNNQCLVTFFLERTFRRLFFSLCYRIHRVIIIKRLNEYILKTENSPKL